MLAQRHDCVMLDVLHRTKPPVVALVSISIAVKSACSARTIHSHSQGILNGAEKFNGLRRVQFRLPRALEDSQPPLITSSTCRCSRFPCSSITSLSRWTYIAVTHASTHASTRWNSRPEILVRKPHAIGSRTVSSNPDDASISDDCIQSAKTLVLVEVYRQELQPRLHWLKSLPEVPEVLTRRSDLPTPTS